MANNRDNELIEAYLSGDEKSLEDLINDYVKPIYGFVFRYVGDVSAAEDITQEAFVKVWRNIKKFDKNKSFKTWIFSIAKNTAIDFLKKKKAVPFSEFNDESGANIIEETFADRAPLPPEIFEKKEIARMMESAISELPPKYRAVLLLRYSNNFTFQEIAESLEKPIDTVKSQHRRALIALRKILKDY